MGSSLPRVLDAARQEPLYKNVNFDAAQGMTQGPVELDTPYQFSDPTHFNAISYTTGHIQIPYSVSELISDSPSEIAWIVAHELGHQIQFRIKGGQPVFANVTSDIETDADIVGMLLSMEAGYDPYAAAGALAKLAMGTAHASPLDQKMVDTSVSQGLRK
jgi:predicted Zn-dependent protease